MWSNDHGSDILLPANAGAGAGKHFGFINRIEANRAYLSECMSHRIGNI